MTRLHKFYFFLWKIKAYFKGVAVGKFAYVYSEGKEKYIKGVITSLNGVSVSNTKYGFDIGLQLFEPTQGYDSRYYSWGSFNLDSIHKRKKYYD